MNLEENLPGRSKTLNPLIYGIISILSFNQPKGSIIPLAPYEDITNQTTYFAPPENAAPDELAFEIELVSQNKIVSGLLHSVSGVLAIVNEKRQVVAFNASFMKMLGVDDAEKHLGLRPGEILQCAEAEKGPAGCGTTAQCRTCGAAIAMVASLADNRPVEMMCAINAVRGDREVDIALNLRAHPITINSKRFLLLFLQDITRQQQQAALERTFYHDISNLMSMLLGASELLLSETDSDLAGIIHRAALRLKQEINIQRCLSENETGGYIPMWNDISCGDLFAELKPFFDNHPAAKDKHLVIDNKLDNFVFRTDISLILRIICNMVTNSFEAAEPGEEVKVWADTSQGAISFKVWNTSAIPTDIQGRIFQRNFSTKQHEGRGVGTFSMKLLGEQILGGKVEFATSSETGTVFSLALPLQRKQPKTL